MITKYIFPVLFGSLLFLLVSCATAAPDLYGQYNYNQQLANAQAAALTATAEAPVIRITETAAAMAIQGTQAQSTSVAAIQTQVGAMTATAIWWTPTPNLDSTATVAALNAQNTAIANQVARDNLQLAREQANNEFWRIAAPIALVFAAGLILVLVQHFLRSNRFQVAKTDARGNVLPTIDIVQGVFTDIDRSPNYKGSVSDDVLARLLALLLEKKFGLRPQLPDVTANRQDATTERDQMIDLATRGLPGPVADNKERQKLASQQVMKQLTDSNLEKRFKIFDGSATDLTVINGDVVEHLDRDWKEAESV